MVWGLCGYWANQIVVQSANPTPAQMLPSLGIALGGGLIGARVAAEVISRMMPPDESQDVSHGGLFGMTGEVAFPVSETGGRILVYDEHGTLHDETCRVTPGTPAIGRGRRVMVVDMDNEGKLLVEEVPSSVQ